MIERIAELVREDKIDQIADLRDESDQRGMSILIELKRGAQPKKVLNQLYKFTALQSTFGVQMLALVDGEPRTLPLKKALQIFIDHRQTVIVRRSNFDLAKARARLHILDGYLLALSNLDAVIKTIRESQDSDVAKTNLMKRFKLSELQAQAILDMQLRRLAALERWKIEEEHKQVSEQIAALEDLLAHPKKILALIQTDLKELAEKYGDDRRTRIASDAKEELTEEDLVQDEAVLISLTERGYVKARGLSRFPFAGTRRARRDGSHDQGRGRSRDAHPRSQSRTRCCSFPIRAKSTAKRFIKSQMQTASRKGFRWSMSYRLRQMNALLQPSRFRIFLHMGIVCSRQHAAKSSV